MYCLTYIWKFKGKIRQKQMEKSTVYRKNYGLIVFWGEWRFSVGEEDFTWFWLKSTLLTEQK